MVANILPADPPPHPTRGQKVNIQLILNNVMLPIKLKGIRNTAKWLANILPADPPPPSGQRLKILLFQNMVLLHFKLKGIIYAATWSWKHFAGRHPIPHTTIV